jgi:hypothetical protein
MKWSGLRSPIKRRIYMKYKLKVIRWYRSRSVYILQVNKTIIYNQLNTSNTM